MINPGMKLWWNNKFMVVDFFRKKYGEPLRCLRVDENQLVVVRVFDEEISFSEEYFRVSPE